ncbi:hypothetical protein J2X01_002784 [Arthrobacter ginsengisoli]|uniref:Uncharacterized protein n=1 Tax=Arthrobacter ginsengisoli TaxID=1356565 RepID=A0ABU1UEC1_9MICC|nr:hypothetical protein [Arthrobacter ginsengisoli]
MPWTSVISAAAARRYGVTVPVVESVVTAFCPGPWQVVFLFSIVAENNRT